MPPSQNAQPSSKAVTPSSSIAKPQRPGSVAPGRLEDVQPRGLFDRGVFGSTSPPARRGALALPWCLFA